MTEATGVQDNKTAIRVGTPLPVDVFVTLGNLLELAYPGTTIQATPPKARWEDTYTEFIIDRSKRVEVSPEQVADAVEESDGEDVEVIGFDDDGHVQFSTPDEASLALGHIAASMLDHSGAVNYLEAEVRDAEGNRYVVCAARSKGQTPHALKTAAEEKLAEAEATIADLRKRVASLEKNSEKHV